MGCKLNRWRARAPQLNESVRSDREGCHRQSESLLDLVEQPPFLPSGRVARTQCDQQVVGREVPDRVFEREQRIVGPDLTYSLASEVSELPEDRLKTLICLLLGPIGVRDQPVNRVGSAGVMTRISSAASIRAQLPNGSAWGPETAWPAAMRRRCDAIAASKSGLPAGRQLPAGRSRHAKVRPRGANALWPRPPRRRVARREGVLVRLVDGIAHRHWLCGLAHRKTERLVLIGRDRGKRTGCAVGVHESEDGTPRRIANGSSSDRLVGGARASYPGGSVGRHPVLSGAL